ncbi:MAG: hypothetical protein HUU49_04850 [Candidatus Buchananbacteria bacterium]|nr:hypothetical protein [Candidatus Buchananbacteria bacterium]
MKTIYTLLLLSIITAALATLTPVLVLAQGGDITQQMQNSLANVSLPSTNKDEGRVEVIVGKVIGAFLSIFGIIFMVLIIFGGYKWMMASGREEEISKAKATIRSAVIGLIIVLAAYAITFFITNALQQAVG